MTVDQTTPKAFALDSKFLADVKKAFAKKGTEPGTDDRRVALAQSEVKVDHYSPTGDHTRSSCEKNPCLNTS